MLFPAILVLLCSSPGAMLGSRSSTRCSRNRFLTLRDDKQHNVFCPAQYWGLLDGHVSSKSSSDVEGGLGLLGR